MKKKLYIAPKTEISVTESNGNILVGSGDMSGSGTPIEDGGCAKSDWSSDDWSDIDW